MRIAWLHEHLLVWDGGLRYIYEMSRRLTREGEVYLYVAGSSPEIRDRFEKAGVRVVDLPVLVCNKPTFWLSFRRQLKRRHGELQSALADCDLILSTSFPMNCVVPEYGAKSTLIFFEPTAFLYDKDFVSGLPLIQRAMAWFGGTFVRGYDLNAARSSHRLVTITRFSAARGLELYGRMADVVYPGVDSTHFKPSHDPKLTEKYSGHNVILHSASYFNPVKGTHFLIEALAHMTDRVPNSRVLILNCKRDENAKARLVNLAQEMGILDRIEFLPLIEDEMLPYYYSLAKVIVQPSINESFRLSLQEGAACETPGICFSGGSADEDIIDGETGFIVPYGDTRALASSIVRVLTDPDLAKRLGVKARDRVRETFNWDSSARALLGRAKADSHEVSSRVTGD